MLHIRLETIFSTCVKFRNYFSVFYPCNEVFKFDPLFKPVFFQLFSPIILNLSISPPHRITQNKYKIATFN